MLFCGVGERVSGVVGLSLCFVFSLDMLLSLAVWDSVDGSPHSDNVDVGDC